MLFTALYYPHTRISTGRTAGEHLLKRALLLWDELEFIVPYPEYEYSYDDPEVAEAVELIGRNHYPSPEERDEAHTRIEDLATRPNLPEVFYYRSTESSYSDTDFHPYEIYPEKLLGRTWELLREAQMTAHPLPDGDYPLSRQAGLSIMAILADCCAGKTRSRVTDRAEAYATIDGLLVDQPARMSIRDRVVDRTLRLVRPQESLVSLRLAMMDIDRISIRRLTEFRKREYAEAGHTLRDLRHRYAEHIEDRVKELTQPELTTSDVRDLEHQFSQKAEDDLSALRQELGETKTDLAGDVIVTVLSTAAKVGAALMEPVHALAGVLTRAGEAVHLGGLISSRNKFLSARAKVLREHPMAFVYELGRG